MTHSALKAQTHTQSQSCDSNGHFLPRMNDELAGSANAAQTSSSLPVSKNYDNVPEIPIEIVSDEEMDCIEAALASASPSSADPAIRSPTSSSLSHRNARSIHSISVLSKRRLSVCTEPDIEDSGNLVGREKKSRLSESFLSHFRRKRSLSVSDLIQTEWCQKQMELALRLGGPKTTKAMRAGIARHVELEEEIQNENLSFHSIKLRCSESDMSLGVMKRVGLKSKSREEIYALMLLKFMNGVNRLRFEGLTRELPV